MKSWIIFWKVGHFFNSDIHLKVQLFFWFCLISTAYALTVRHAIINPDILLKNYWDVWEVGHSFEKMKMLNLNLDQNKYSFAQKLIDLKSQTFLWKIRLKNQKQPGPCETRIIFINVQTNNVQQRTNNNHKLQKNLF